MPRLRRTSPGQPGWTRRRTGRGFGYTDQHGDRITDPEALDRLRGLVIPPAWKDVWITPFPNGHLQAVGTDAAGRRQYLYHPQWAAERARRKHAHVVDFARRLPVARKRVSADLALTGLPRDRVLAAAFRMIDRGLFRIGGEHYTEENGSFGLATLRKEHLRIASGAMVFDYIAKSGNQRAMLMQDDDILPILAGLRRRRDGGEELLAYRVRGGWRDLGSDDINTYIKTVVSPDASAKDFRTWHGTVLAAVAFAGQGRPRSQTAAKREVSGAMRQVSQYLGNTPAVCRASYVDPRVIDKFLNGETLPAARRPVPVESDGLIVPAPDPRTERAVLKLLLE